MKKITLILALTIFASSAHAGYWHCESTSTYSGYGWGEHVNRAIAENLAVRNCQLETPVGYYCSIPICVWYY